MTWSVKVIRGALALGVIAVLAIGSGAGWWEWFSLGWFE